MKKYILDSYAMIAFFEDEAGADLVADILQDLIQKKGQGFMSLINWGEIYYTVMREQGFEKAEQTIRQLEKYPIQLIEADRSLTYEAAKLKGAHKIAFADCFAAALAIMLKACLVTGDPEFKKIKPGLDILWI